MFSDGDICGTYLNLTEIFRVSGMHKRINEGKWIWLPKYFGRLYFFWDLLLSAKLKRGKKR